ncbi:TonB-dependent receptor [Ravibacter arvi]|uniref:TonB-dependent receptor n=2 Tax=Ravibacter arvi TaxID=2051041 RepID=A0ABP8M256_9BACT
MLGFFQANAGFLLQKLSLRFKNAPLEQVLKTLRKRSGHQFIYSNELIKKANPVSIDIDNGTLEDILKITFQNQPLTYEIIDQAIVVKAKTSGAAKTVERQDNTSSVKTATEVNGVVVDEKNEPLIGVSILVKGTQLGTTTDINGRFSLNVTGQNPVLVLSFVGFVTQEVEVGTKTELSITLQADNRTLEELVVVGYGTQKKVNLTGAVQNVKGEDLVRRNATNTSNALQGLVPGVSVTQSSGRPGADGATIRIRGTGSINSSAAPLILIDGVEGDMNNIDMNSIASISVLKDAASASIYGSRASNGVILITTKRADKGALKINYSGFAGVNTPTEMPDPLSAIEYMEAINVARANSNLAPQYSEELINKYKTEGADGLERYDTDWRKEVIRNNAFMQNHSVSMGAGTEKFRFFGNVGMFTQDGSIANNNYRRLTMRMNTDAQINKWLKIGTDLNLRSSKAERPAVDSPETIINKATTFVPVFSGINPDGTWGYGQNGDNPIASSRASGTHNETTPEMILKGFANITPLAGLDFLTSYSVRRLETKSDYFIRPYRTYENGVFKTTYPSGGTEKQEAWTQLITKQFNLQGSYEKQLGSHYLKLLAGIQTEDKAARSFAASRKGFAFPGYEDLNHGDVATSIGSGSHWDWGIFSQFNRINYNFKERYLLELTGRWDASSRFKKEYRWGFFPSASVGWRLSEENFFAPARGVVNDLKFRASYGTLGNQDIANGYFPYAATIAPSSGYWFDKLLTSSAIQTQVANEKISWEKSTQLNFGLDAELMSSQLVMSLDYYVRNINDMLQQFPIPAYVGLASPWENAGSMRNRGWDLSLTWRDRIGEVKYSVSANVSDVKNKIVNLYGKEYVTEKITREGDPIDSWYGYVAQGFFQNQSEIDNSPVYGERQNVKPGYIKYQDLSGPEGKPDGVINAFDRTIIGNPAPRYEYSLNLSAEWKGFDFTMFFQGVGKRDIFYSGGGARPFYVGRSMFRHQLDYWTETNRDAAFPILLIDGSGTNPNNIVSSFWVKSGAYARLKNAVLGYTLPASVTQKVKLGKARFYVSGQNLLTISNAYKGYDPENAVQGGSFYPVMRSLTAGLDIQF